MNTVPAPCPADLKGEGKNCGLSLGWGSLPGSWVLNTNCSGGVTTLLLLSTEQLHFIAFWMEYCSYFIKYVCSIKYGLVLGFAGDQCVADFPIWPKLFALVLWPGKQMYAFQRLLLRCFKLFHCNMEQILTCHRWKKSKPVTLQKWVSR